MLNNNAIWDMSDLSQIDTFTRSKIIEIGVGRKEKSLQKKLRLLFDFLKIGKKKKKISLTEGEK